MKTTKWMRIGMLALLGAFGGLALTTATEAASVRVETIAPGCTSSCVDTWLVSCPNAATHSVQVRVRDAGGTLENVGVLNLGQFPGVINNVLGDADLERSAGLIFSPLASVARTGAGVGAMRTVAQIFIHSGATLATPYVAEFSCRALNGAQVGNPGVILMQDQ